MVVKRPFMNQFWIESVYKLHANIILFLQFFHRLVIDETKDGFQMSIYASVQISKGAPILFNYVRPLDTHVLRKENLYNFKYFTCKCKRCEDPTELNTFNSAYLCPTCQTGPVVKIGLFTFISYVSKKKLNNINLYMIGRLFWFILKEIESNYSWTY